MRRWKHCRNCEVIQFRNNEIEKLRKYMGTETNEQYPGLIPGSKEALIELTETLLFALQGSQRLLKAIGDGQTEVSDLAKAVQAEWASVHEQIEILSKEYSQPKHGTTE